MEYYFNLKEGQSSILKKHIRNFATKDCISYNILVQCEMGDVCMNVIKQLKPYLVSILIALAVGALGGIVTSNGMPNYEQIIKPALTPPSIVFPIVWTILYILMGISAAMVWKQESSKQRRFALIIYALQLVLNFLWSYLFFSMQAYFLSFVCLLVLWVLIVMMIWSFSRVDPRAARLQIPYLLWVTFAGYLNFAVWLLNR